MAILENRVKIESPNIVVECSKLLFARTKPFAPVIPVIIALFLLQFNIPKPISSLSLEISGMALFAKKTIINTLSTSISSGTNFISHITNTRLLEEENLALKDEIVRLQTLNTQLHRVEIENKILRKLLVTIPEQENYTRITARLLNPESTAPNDCALVAAGSNNGVKPHDVVMSVDGLIGQVIEVGPNYSKVMLVNNVDSRIPIVGESSRERGILLGNYRSSIIYLRSDHQLKLGETILTSGDSKIFPPGLVTARVIAVKPNDVLVEPVSLNNTDFVAILSKH